MSSVFFRSQKDRRLPRVKILREHLIFQSVSLISGIIDRTLYSACTENVHVK